MKPRLIVTVDTEEEGLWGGRYPSSGNTVRNVEELPRFQELCDRLGVRPTYLADAPVVEDDRAASILRELAADGRSEIGAHVHPWCNPPLTELRDTRETYLCNLPAAEQRAKIAWLTDHIEERIERRPTSFRAGRYGLSNEGLAVLHELGYVVDSSVIPFLDYSSQGGPDFSDAPWRAYRVGEELRREDPQGGMVEAPVSVGYSCRRFDTGQRVLSGIRRRRWMRSMRIEGMLDRTGLLQQIKLSPEQSSAARMNRLVDRLVDQRAPALVMMFHSSSLLPGSSPYVRSAAERDHFLRRIEETCTYSLQQHGLMADTLSGFAAAWPNRTERSGAAADPAEPVFQAS